MNRLMGTMKIQVHWVFCLSSCNQHAGLDQRRCGGRDSKGRRGRHKLWRRSSTKYLTGMGTLDTGRSKKHWNGLSLCSKPVKGGHVANVLGAW